MALKKIYRFFEIIYSFIIFIFSKYIYIMERGLTMLLHSAIIGVLLYAVMIIFFKQSPELAENRSLILSAIILIYMILFGHGLPTTVNKNV